MSDCRWGAHPELGAQCGVHGGVSGRGPVVVLAEPCDKAPSTPPIPNSAENKAASASEVALLNEKHALSPSASEPTTHELKVWTRFWSALESGQKNFEVRYNDRDFQAGDTLWLRDYNPYGGGIYSGKECWRTISYVFDGRDCAGLGVEPGYVVLGLATATSTPRGERYNGIR